MRADCIKLHNFRNICDLELTLCKNANIIYGDNGQGKTNFLEAIWLFTGAKSFRGARDSQLVRFEQPHAKLEMQFTAGGRSQSAEITIASRRSASVNDIPLRSPTELAGRFCAVVFSPTHLALIKDGPQEKRRFIDTAVCQMKPRFIHMLNQYHRVLEQRNRLLKDIAYQQNLMSTLDVWDARLASFAAVIIKTRTSFVDRLRGFAKEIYAGISQEKEALDFHYVSTLACDLSADIPEIEKQILSCLQMNRQEDLRAGVTTNGPHRDDIDITLSGSSARTFGSQGQQRSCVLSLKLAECELIRETIGEYPVVLLDDVMSELDLSRRDYLLNHLRGRQVLITCCDEKDFRTLGQGLGICIQNGAAVSCKQY